VGSRLGGDADRAGDEDFHGESPALGRQANAPLRNDNADQDLPGGQRY